MPVLGQAGEHTEVRIGQSGRGGNVFGDASPHADFRGTRTPEEGAEAAIRLATVDENGPTGAAHEDERRLAR